MKRCEWKFVAVDDDDDDHYESECGGEWFFFEGTVKENQMDLCPFCGEPIIELEPIL